MPSHENISNETKSNLLLIIEECQYLLPPPLGIGIRCSWSADKISNKKEAFFNGLSISIDIIKATQ